jgi:hypothetical protein
LTREALLRHPWPSRQSNVRLRVPRGRPGNPPQLPGRPRVTPGASTPGCRAGRSRPVRDWHPPGVFVWGAQPVPARGGRGGAPHRLPDRRVGAGSRTVRGDDGALPRGARSPLDGSERSSSCVSPSHFTRQRPPNGPPVSRLSNVGSASAPGRTPPGGSRRPTEPWRPRELGCDSIRCSSHFSRQTQITDHPHLCI